jgi:hypothetical protein
MMTTLPDEEIKAIVKKVAKANNIPAQAVSTSTVMGSSGHEAVEVVISIPLGASLQIVGSPSARTVIEVIQKLADAGEERFPIVQFGETGNAP